MHKICRYYVFTRWGRFRRLLASGLVLYKEEYWYNWEIIICNEVQIFYKQWHYKHYVIFSINLHITCKSAIIYRKFWKKSKSFQLSRKKAIYLPFLLSTTGCLAIAFVVAWTWLWPENNTETWGSEPIVMLLFLNNLC